MQPGIRVWALVLLAALGPLLLGPALAKAADLELHHAALRGDVATVTRLLSQGRPVDAVDDKGATALVHALRGGRLEVARVLLQAGATPHSWKPDGRRFVSPLGTAIERDDVAAVKLLIEYRAGAQWIGRRDLQVFSDYYTWTSLERLPYDEQAVPKFDVRELEAAVELAAGRGAGQIVALLLEHRETARLQRPPVASDHPLAAAAHRGDVVEIRRLLSANDQHLWPATTFVRAYQHALQQGQIEAAVILGPLARDRVLRDHTAAAPASVLAAVESKDYRQVVAALLRGGDPNEQQVVNGLPESRPLHQAAINANMDGNLEIVELLLRYGANPHLRDRRNQRPIDHVNDPNLKALLQKAMASKPQTPHPSLLGPNQSRPMP